jgi:3-hydroxybutyryl-CoA dehydrogenase
VIPELDRSDRPHPYLEQQVQAGRLGFKTGVGFRTWTPEEMSAVRQRLAAHLLEAQRRIPS